MQTASGRFQTIASGGWFHFFISKEYIIKSVCGETHAFCRCLLTSIYISWFIYQWLISINLSGGGDTKSQSWVLQEKHLHKPAVPHQSRGWGIKFRTSHQQAQGVNVQHVADCQSVFVWWRWIKVKSDDVKLKKHTAPECNLRLYVCNKPRPLPHPSEVVGVVSNWPELPYNLQFYKFYICKLWASFITFYSYCVWLDFSCLEVLWRNINVSTLQHKVKSTLYVSVLQQ